MNPNVSELHLLGIDVSKLTFDACLLHAGGPVASARFENSPRGFAELDRWLRGRGAGQTLAGIEATGPYGAGLLWHLHGGGHRVAQLNARRVKDYARSQGRRAKTDRADAAIIARYLRHSDGLVIWNPPAKAISELQALVRRRQDLAVALQAERNRKAAGAGGAVGESLERQMGHIKAEMGRIGRAIDAHVRAHPGLHKSVRLLCSIDGVGPVVATAILSEIPAISAFARARDVAAFAGVTPSVCESGTSVRRRGRMTKEGSALLRKMLYMADLQAAKGPRNAFHKTYKALVDRGKAKKCALGAIMHKLVRVAFGVLKHQTPFAENLAKI